jgi:transcriptional regulator with XRE-family HTH domain
MTPIERALSQSKSGRRELKRQELIVSVTEQIWAAMEAAGVAKSDLARTLEQSKSHITQLLSGDRNMTLATLADIAEALGLVPCVQLGQSPALIASMGKRVHDVERRVATKVVRMELANSTALNAPFVTQRKTYAPMSATNQTAFAASV